MFDKELGEMIRVCSEQDLFCRLQMGKDSRSVLILGYKVVLTETEFIILNCLYENGETVAREFFESEYGISYSSIPVHVAHINKKALPITGRRLIESNGSVGYRISRTM